MGYIFDFIEQLEKLYGTEYILSAADFKTLIGNLGKQDPIEEIKKYKCKIKSKKHVSQIEKIIQNLIEEHEFAGRLALCKNLSELSKDYTALRRSIVYYTSDDTKNKLLKILNSERSKAHMGMDFSVNSGKDNRIVFNLNKKLQFSPFSLSPDSTMKQVNIEFFSDGTVKI